eukprot:2289755-Pyramimonas_sp.AAC.1
MGHPVSSPTGLCLTCMVPRPLPSPPHTISAGSYARRWTLARSWSRSGVWSTSGMSHIPTGRTNQMRGD